MEKPKIIIIDVDGTIAKIDHRYPKIKVEPKDWAGFYMAADKDEPLIENIKTIKADLEANGAQPVFVTGRSDISRDITFAWITQHFFSGATHPYVLHMRIDGDHREDFEVKKEINENHLAEFNVIRVYEDRPQVIRMWKELGYEVVDVGPGFEF